MPPHAYQGQQQPYAQQPYPRPSQPYPPDPGHHYPSSYPAYTRQAARGFPPAYPSAPPPTPPASQSPVQPGAARGIGGVLTSLINPAGGAAGLPAAASSLNFGDMLLNAQKAIQTAQTVLPMIQQIGPMIKNAPDILSSLKNLQNKAEEKPAKETAKKAEPDNQNSAEKDSAQPPENEKETKQEAAEDDDKRDVPATAEKPADASSEPAPPLEKSKAETDLERVEHLVSKPSMPRMYI